MLIGLTGYKGVGKDTVGQYLVDNYGFTRLAFAGKLKEAVANLFGISIEAVDEFKEIGKDDLPVVEVGLFQYNTVEWVYSWREFLQRFGTEMGRNTFGEDFWVWLWEQQADPFDDVVATDVRFSNEAKRIRKLQGYIVEITRPGHEPDGHASEEPLPEEFVNSRIRNEGTINDLHNSVDRFMQAMVDDAS